LIKRGDITLWFSEDIVDSWYYGGPKKRGVQKVYSDHAIKVLLTVRSVLHLRLRNLQGFMGSLTKIMGVDITIPDYTTICRRQRGLNVTLYKRDSLKRALACDIR